VTCSVPLNHFRNCTKYTLKILSSLLASPSKYKTVSTICSKILGPAIEPSLVIWPIIKIGILNSFASLISSNVVSPPVSIQALEEDELGDFKVELAEEPETVSPISSLKKEAIEEPKVIEESKVIEEPVILKSVDELDIDKIANEVKLAIAKNEEAELKAAELVKSENRSVKSKPLEIPVEDSQSAYLEELAKLSKEIDKERE